MFLLFFSPDGCVLGQLCETGFLLQPIAENLSSHVELIRSGLSRKYPYSFSSVCVWKQLCGQRADKGLTRAEKYPFITTDLPPCAQTTIFDIWSWKKTTRVIKIWAFSSSSPGVKDQFRPLYSAVTKHDSVYHSLFSALIEKCFLLFFFVVFILMKRLESYLIGQLTFHCLSSALFVIYRKKKLQVFWYTQQSWL